MNSKLRRAAIAEQLGVKGEASIVELAALFGTSEMTIRRDLDFLEMEGLARRARGGAISVQGRAFEPPILQRAALQADAKRRIGAAAASLVRENETIAIDVGSTTHEMAKALPDTLEATVITNSLLVATEMATKPAHRTIITGGTVRQGELSLIGPLARDSYRSFNCDTVFLGVAGVDDLRGLSEYNIDDADVKEAIVDAGRRVVVLADATKVGRVTFVTFASIDRVDILVTDASPDDPVIRRIKEHDVEVLHVEPFAEKE